MPVCELIGPMNSACDWRVPNASANTAPAASAMKRGRRSEDLNFHQINWRRTFVLHGQLLTCINPTEMARLEVPKPACLSIIAFADSPAADREHCRSTWPGEC